MDQGYANFRIDSTQVAIAPEKDDIFITVNVDEGAGLQARRREARGHLRGAGGGAAALPAVCARARPSRASSSPPRRS